MTERRLGILFILLSGVAFGSLGIFGKTAFEQGLSPGELLSMRFLFGALLLALFLIIKQRASLVLGVKNTLICVILGVLGYAVFATCYFTALTGLSVSITVLLLYTFPLQVTLGAWLLYGEKVSARGWAAWPISVVGLILLLWGDIQIKDPMAIIAGLGAAFFYSIYILASSRLLKNVDAMSATVWVQVGAGIALALLYLRDVDRVQAIVVNSWPVLLGIAVIGTALAMSLFLAGLKRLKNWEASLLSTAEPITAIFLAAGLLEEKLTSIQLLGGLILLGAFSLVVWPTRQELGMAKIRKE